VLVREGGLEPHGRSRQIRFNEGQPVSIRIAKAKSKYAKREIPLTFRAAVSLSACLPQSRCSFVFTSKNGHRPLTRYYPGEQLRTIRNPVNLGPDYVLQSTRHSLCTRPGKAGAGAFTIQQLAGHSSITISQRQVHADREIKQSAIRLPDALNVPKPQPSSDTIKEI